MRPRFTVEWDAIKENLVEAFGMDSSKLSSYDDVSKESLLESYEMMMLCRQFENACNQAYMQVGRRPVRQALSASCLHSSAPCLPVSLFPSFNAYWHQPAVLFTCGGSCGAHRATSVVSCTWITGKRVSRPS